MVIQKKPVISDCEISVSNRLPTHKNSLLVSAHDLQFPRRRRTLDPISEIEKTRKATYFIQKINTNQLNSCRKVPPIDASFLNDSVDAIAQHRREVDQLGNKIIHQLKKSFRKKTEEVENNIKLEEQKRISDELENKKRSRQLIDFAGMVSSTGIA